MPSFIRSSFTTVPPSLHVVNYPLEKIRPDLSYEEEPEAILDREERVIHRKTIPFVKVLRKNYSEREATWKTKEPFKKRPSPQLFQ